MDIRDLAEKYLRGDLYRVRRNYRRNYYSGGKISVLEDIASEFLEFIQGIPTWKFEFMEKVFKFGRKIGKECRIGLREVEALFNDVLPRYVGGGMLGCFVSGIYHDMLEDDDTLTFNLSGYRGSVSGIGFRHRKGELRVVGNRALYLGFEMEGGRIVVNGNVGNFLGKGMRGGVIEVLGNARDWVGLEMRGGRIAVRGNVGSAIGVKMMGGEIIVEGNAGFWIGDDMRGGVIRVKGSVRSVSRDRSGGKIYVWRNGWIEIEG